MYGLFLAFHASSGERLVRPLDTNNTSFCLAPSAPKDSIDLMMATKAGVLIDIDYATETAMVTNFDECTILGGRNSEIKLPGSTTNRCFTMMLREGDHILTPAGRWEILWEDEHGSIHNSMRPPALPKPPIPSDGALEPLDTEDSAAAQVEDATPDPQSPLAPSNDPAANINSASVTSNSEIVDGTTLPSTAASRDEVPDIAISLAASNSTPATSIELDPTQTPQRPPKRCAESSAGQTSNKKVRLRPQSPEISYDDNSMEPKVNRTIVEVGVSSTPKVVSERKSKERAREVSTASPVPRTRFQDSDSPDWAPVVYMSGTTTIDRGHKKIMRSFRELGGSITKNIVDADVLCVGKDKPLMKSGSLLLAITSGKIIVTEDWIIDATRRDAFPDPKLYLPKDPGREREWDFNLATAIARGREGLTHLLSGFTIYLTKRLQQSVSGAVATELSKLATALGADEVKKSSPSKRFLEETADLSTLVILGHEADPELPKLVDGGLSIYSKDLLTMAALRGELEFDIHVLASAVKEEQD